MGENKLYYQINKVLLLIFLFLIQTTSSLCQTVSYIDQNNNLKVDDEPFLPIGFYCEYMNFNNYPTLAQDLRNDGFNAMVTSVYVNDTSSYKDFLIGCDTLGIKNFVALPKFTADSALFVNHIRALKNSPSLIGWKLLPYANSEDLSVTINQKNQLWQRDSSRITYVGSNQNTPPFEYVLDYVEASTMVLEPYGYPWLAFDLDVVAFRYRFQVQKAEEKGVFPMILAQASNWDPNPYPTPEHLDAQSYLGYVTGNKGVLFYTILDSNDVSTINNTQPGIYNAAKNIADEVLNSELKDVFLYGEHEYNSDAPYQHYGTWKYNNFLYVIAVNAHESDSRFFNIPIPTNVAGPAINMFSSRLANMHIQNGELTGLMTPYHVSIVKIPLSNLAVAEESAFKSITVFPNPSKGIFRISGIDQPFTYSVLNITGQCLIKSNTANNGTSIDMSNVPDGIYYLMINGEDNQPLKPIKIIKN